MKTLHYTSVEDIHTIAGILLNDGKMVTASTVKTAAPKIINAITCVPLDEIGRIGDVVAVFNDGPDKLPTMISIPWECLRVAGRDWDTVTEDLVRRLVDDRFNALVRGTHNKLVSGELYDKETVDELRRQLDTANNACTVLQMREAAANNELAEMRDAADRTSRSHKKDIAQLNATIKSLQSVNRYTAPTGTMLDAYNTLADQDEMAGRLVLRSAANLFQEDCADLKHVADFDLATYHFNDKPERVKRYIHSALDNLNAAGTLRHVTRQMMYAMHAEASQVNREMAVKDMLAISETNQVVGIADKDIERAYKAFRDIVNCEGIPRD